MTRGVQIKIETNAIQAKHFFDSLERSQLPFAISRAINRLAWDVRDWEQKNLDRYFDLRTTWLTKKGAMPVIRSDKRQHPDIHAIIGVKDEVAAMAITGGVRRSTGGDMAVPFSDAGGGRSARSIINPGRETLPKSKWPSKIVKAARKTTRRSGRALKPKPFYLKSRTGRTFVALRTGVSNLPLRLLYEFKPSVTVPKSWPFVRNASAVVAAKYDDYLEQELKKAVKTMRF